MDRIEALGARIHQHLRALRAAEARRDLMGDNGPTEELVRRAVEEEREACATIVEEEARKEARALCYMAAGHLREIAAAIRRRGQ